MNLRESKFLKIILGILIVATLAFLITCIIRKVNKNHFTDISMRKVDVPALFDALVPSPREKAESLYTPIICRPPERYGKRYSGRCTNELYPKNSSPYGKGEFVGPCNPEILAKYYAQRPLISPDAYYNKLQELFNACIDKVPKDIPINNINYPIAFCNENTEPKLMKFIKDKLAKAKNELPSWRAYAKNDTWGGEQLAFWNEKITAFSTNDTSEFSEERLVNLAKRNQISGIKRYIVTFTIQNTLRSASTDVIAVVFERANKLYLGTLEFATINKSLFSDPDPNVPHAYDLESKKPGGINLNNANLNPSNNVPSWIYGNTLENKIFNSQGFYDAVHPERNIVIPGGVPEQFAEVLKNHDQGYLQPPYDAFSFNRVQGGPLHPNKLNTVTNSDVYPSLTDKKSWKVFV
jgi:hypothetical protein